MPNYELQIELTTEEFINLSASFLRIGNREVPEEGVVIKDPKGNLVILSLCDSEENTEDE